MSLIRVVCSNCGYTREISAVALPQQRVNVTCPKCKHMFIFDPASAAQQQKTADIRVQQSPPEPRVHRLSLKRGLNAKANKLLLALILVLILITFGGMLWADSRDKAVPNPNLLPASNENAVDISRRQSELSNTALKKLYDIGNPDVAQIKSLLSAHDFMAVEKLYEDFFHQTEKDIQSENFLHQAYNIFAPTNDLSIEDLDVWVAKTGSYIAYAARGQYKAELGFIARGGKYISDTPGYKLDEMQRLHIEAAKDLQIAINKKPSLMPPYSCLVSIAKTSNMPFSAKQILDKAEENDKRTFWVRSEYMRSLQPRWGGSYEEMSKFAQHAIKFVELNPRLWTLQGDEYIDRADEYYREGNYDAVIQAYTEALKFGDRVSWLKTRAASYYKQGQIDKSIADYKRVLYYDPTDSMARTFASSDNSLDLKYNLIENSHVYPKISGLHIKSYAVLSVEHQVKWLNTRPDKGKVVVYNNIAKIERMLRRLGYDCIERAKIAELLDHKKLSVTALTNEKAQQIGKLIKADAIIIATIPSMGKDHSRDMFYENVEIKAISVATGQILWDSWLKGSVVADQDKYDYTLILDSIENKLYDLLQSKLKADIRPVKE